MKHFDRSAWLLYKQGSIKKEKSEQLEQHLYECEECQEAFLSLIDETQIAAAGKMLPEDFTGRVMHDLAEEKSAARSKQRMSEKKKNLIIYYVAAASITIVFVAGGLFRSLVYTGPQVLASLNSQLSITSSQTDYKWPGRIVDKVAKMINNYEVYGRFGNEEEK